MSAAAFTESYAAFQRAASQQEPSYRVRGILTDGFDSTLKSLRTLFPGVRLAPNMPGSVGWRWKEARSPHVIGSSISKSSSQEAFYERIPALPLNAMECGNSCRSYGISSELAFSYPFKHVHGG